jgi:hypothetical protein
MEIDARMTLNTCRVARDRQCEVTCESAQKRWPMHRAWQTLGAARHTVEVVNVGQQQFILEPERAK